MKHPILFSLLLFLGISLQAQNFRFGLTGSLGYSKIASDFPFPEDYQIFATSSGKIGGFVEKKISTRATLGMELLWLRMEGREYRNLGEFIKNPGFFRSSSFQSYLIFDATGIHANYIAVPVCYHYSLGRFGLRGGLQSLILLSMTFDKYERKSQLPLLEEEPFYHAEYASQLSLRKFDLGPQIGITFRLNDHFRLQTDYYHGLLNLVGAEGVWSRKNRQWSFGVAYLFAEKR